MKRTKQTKPKPKPQQIREVRDALDTVGISRQEKTVTISCRNIAQAQCIERALKDRSSLAFLIISGGILSFPGNARAAAFELAQQIATLC
jgi:hypothetical protein